jgi:hypothetical protein
MRKTTNKCIFDIFKKDKMGEAAIKGQRWWATPLVAAAAVVGNNRAWFVQFAGLLLLAEAVLNALIIRFVPCTVPPS